MAIFAFIVKFLTLKFTSLNFISLKSRPLKSEPLRLTIFKAVKLVPFFSC